MYPDAYPPSAAGAPTVSSGGTVTAANWRKMQLVGCVFLPAAGRTYSGTARDVGTFVMCWTPQKSGSSDALYVRGEYPKKMETGFSLSTGDNKTSVRLVHTL